MKKFTLLLSLVAIQSLYSMASDQSLLKPIASNALHDAKISSETLGLRTVLGLLIADNQQRLEKSIQNAKSLALSSPATVESPDARMQISSHSSPESSPKSVRGESSFTVFAEAKQPSMILGVVSYNPALPQVIIPRAVLPKQEQSVVMPVIQHSGYQSFHNPESDSDSSGSEAGCCDCFRGRKK